MHISVPIELKLEKFYIRKKKSSPTRNAESVCNCCKRLDISFVCVSISGITVRIDCALELLLLRLIIGVTDVNELLDTGRDR